MLRALLLILIMFSLAEANFHQIPFHTPKLGYVFKEGNPAAPVHIEMFFDAQCGDAKDGYQAVFEAADYYGPDTVYLVLHGLPLPYLRGSFISIQALRAVDRINSTITEEYLKLIFDNQYKIGESPSYVSDSDFLEVLVEMAEELGFSEQEFLESYNDPETGRLCRYDLKMANTRGVHESPWFFVNGVTVLDYYPTWTFENWKALIDPLVMETGISDRDPLVMNVGISDLEALVMKISDLGNVN